MDEFRKKQPIDIEWDIQDTAISKGVEDHLFRIVQEAFQTYLDIQKRQK